MDVHGAVNAPLAGKSAVVTGASRGIGRAIATALAAGGARVVAIARDSRALEQLVAETGAGALAIACDLAREEQVESALARLRQTVGTPDLLVNNAGIFALGAIGTLPPSEVDRMVQLNLLAPYRLMHALVPGMRQRGSGHVITIGSIADRTAFPENAGYAAGKFGARAMHEVLRQELRGSGVRVSLVSPGPTDTAIWDPIDPDARPGFTRRTQMLRADAVADAVLWLATRPAEVNVDELRVSHS
ncbi:MAG: SDR family oxidoreductase [Gemmatimonadaceae bacterium]|nr:SDR family oxidoreductase [Gemmatimonadaceae bacterium]